MKKIFKNEEGDNVILIIFIVAFGALLIGTAHC